MNLHNGPVLSTDESILGILTLRFSLVLDLHHNGWFLSLLSSNHSISMLLAPIPITINNILLHILWT
jgi:hypothetical protein